MTEGDKLMRILSLILLLFAMPVGTYAADRTPCEPRPLIVAHRGASGLRPEHTLPAYQLAIEQGADYVEPDLVATKDHVLICRHDCELGWTTDAGKKFPDRKRTQEIDGRRVTGWFAADFTLAEIKQLRARERLPFRNQQFNGQFEIPTFEELIDLVQDQERRAGRRIGLCPEIKHPLHHTRIEKPLEQALVEVLHRRGYRDPSDPCILQSFEPSSLKRLSGATRLRLLQLIGSPQERPADVTDSRYADMIRPAGLRRIANYAWGVGVPKLLVAPTDTQHRLKQQTSLIADAHDASLAVFAYTFRDEDRYLPADDQGHPAAEYRRWKAYEVDGLFTDFPATAVGTLRNPDLD